jgi:hypothetical protein
VNGKTRAKLSVQRDAHEDAIVAAAQHDAAMKRFLQGMEIRRVVYVPNRLLNLVVGKGRADKALPERVPLLVELNEGRATRESLYSRPWVDSALRDSLRVADVVFVPWEKFREVDEPLFPSGTAELFQALRVHAPNLRSEIAVSDEAYSEVALHADVVFLPTLLLSSVAVPIVVNLVSEWLSERLLERAKDADVKFEVIVEDSGGGTRLLRYEGPVSSFESLVNQRLAGLIPGGNLSNEPSKVTPPIDSEGADREQ